MDDDKPLGSCPRAVHHITRGCISSDTVPGCSDLSDCTPGGASKGKDAEQRLFLNMACIPSGSGGFHQADAGTTGVATIRYLIGRATLV